MGRIAEALKRAEGERAEKLRLRGPAQDAAGGEVRATAAAALLARMSAPPPRGERLSPPRPPSDRSADAAEATDPRDAHGRIIRLDPPRLAAIDERIVCIKSPASALAEQYRAVRTWLMRHNSTGEHRSLAITSSAPAEGKSITTANLGLALAEVRHLSVLLIDADLRRGSLARLLGAPPAPGLSDVLRGRTALNDAVHPTGIRNLSILPAGALEGGSPAEMLSSRTAQVLFDEARERFHYVLVDTPPVQNAADVGIVGGMCSGVLMVVRVKSTPEHVVRQSVRWLQANNLQMLGCIVTGADGPKGGLASGYGAAQAAAYA